MDLGPLHHTLRWPLATHSSLLTTGRLNLGFTLLELLIVIAVICILVGALLPRDDAGVLDSLRSAAQIVGSQFDYGRGLAMANNDAYKFTFDIAQNRMILQHSGTNTTLNILPETPFPSPGDTKYQQATDLDEFPRVGPAARIVKATLSGTTQTVTDVEFNSLGATTRSAGTVIWLAAGNGSLTRYITITVDPVIGTSQIGEYSATGPQ
jgi:prepilin-type N-terminal cleavage/methylation domain-containing protein